VSTRDERRPAGTPIWVELVTAEPAAAHAFYRAVFGWQFRPAPPELGSYMMGLVHGRPVAGIGAAPAGKQAPAAWTTYLAADLVDKICDCAVAFGGTVLAGPVTVGRQGRTAVVADPTGAVFGLWQARDHLGAQVVDEPGTMVWTECLTRDAPAAREFYNAILHYRYAPVEGFFDYTMIARRGGDEGPQSAIGGIGGLEPQTPPEVSSGWMTHFGVDDLDAAVQRVTTAGGTVLAAREDSRYGRPAVCRDPQGAVFALVQVQPMP
jgi:predicted enzyme related to lactoylglutathione lyase